MILYTTEHCPQCRFIKQKLLERGIPYIVCMDTSVMEEKGVKNVPTLELDDGTLLRFLDAMKYVERVGLT